MPAIIALWSHMRARSTAFLRMMIERKDVLVIHEPLVTLLDEGEVPVPDGQGGQVILTSEKALFSHMRALARFKTVFFKETVEHRFSYLFEHPEDVADIVHTFIIRDPRYAIASVYKMKPDVVSAQVGYEHLHEIFELSRGLSDKVPLVINGDSLVTDPGGVISKYCQHVGLSFDPNALNWQPGAQPQWVRTQRWHEDVSHSSGFATFENRYEQTVENDELLKGFFRYHNHFYQKLLPYSI